MFERLFDFPLMVVGPAIVVFLCVFAIVGLSVVRRWVLPRLRVEAEDSEFTGAMLQSVMVFYGLAVALIAVSVWQTYSDVSKIISDEATALAALYRDVSGYPDPLRQTLQGELREYTRYTIEDAWLVQQQGKVPVAGVQMMNNFQATLIPFEPTTESQKLLHAETLRAYNEMMRARRLRLESVHTGLPNVMWAVIIIGGLIGLSGSFFFKVEDVRLQKILVLLLATFIGLIIFMILAFDRPFRGDLALTPEPYRLIYEQIMKP